MNVPRDFTMFVAILSLIAVLYALDIRFDIFPERIAKVRSGINSKPIPVPEYDSRTNTEQFAIDSSFYERIDNMVDVVADSIGINKNDEKIVVATTSSGITAKAYLVGDLETGEVLFESRGDLTLPIASMSKLMTAYVGLMTMAPTTTIEISEQNTKVYPDQSNLRAGEKFQFSEILYPLLLNSSNVAAEAIASSYGRKDFLELMSSYAWEIGLPTSYFSDPSGLSPNNKASVKGFFELTKYIYKNMPELLSITRKVELSSATTTEHDFHRFTNIHPFARITGFVGGKTGRTTEAGETMLTILNMDNRPIAFIVLGSHFDKRKSDTDLLIAEYEKKYR